MDSKYAKWYYEIEEKYWWFKARREIIFELLQDYSTSDFILEIGCSGGPLQKLLRMNKYYNSYGIDLSNDAIRQCHAQSLSNTFIMDAAHPALKLKKFDVIVASDILEHIENDSDALKKWYDLLLPGGKLILFVPAYKCLWSYHDDINFHFRRYSKRNVKTLLLNNNFDIEKLSSWNFVTMVPIVIIRFFIKFFRLETQEKDLLSTYRVKPLSNVLLLMLLRIENVLLKFVSIPIGLSVFAIAVKKNID